MNATSKNLVIIARSESDPYRFVRFVWSEDLTDCNFAALGIEDEDVDAIIAAKGHEGADVDGYTIEIA